MQYYERNLKYLRLSKIGKIVKHLTNFTTRIKMTFHPIKNKTVILL